MANPHLLQRLAGVQAILNGFHQAGASMSSASKGTERAAFVNQFLALSLPPVYRFGFGDVTDTAGNRSGQLDVVIEHPFAPCLPTPAGETRLYLAEGVAAVVEVKSDVATQWSQAVETATKLAKLERSWEPLSASNRNHSIATEPSNRIPLWVVGYTGWKGPETIVEHLDSTPAVTGVLVIDAGLYVGRRRFETETVTGPAALWAMVSALFLNLAMIRSVACDPYEYIE